MSASSTLTLPAFASASTSSLVVAPGTMPAETGFIPTARRPDAASARRIAQATTVLPMPVSVPVTKTPGVMRISRRADVIEKRRPDRACVPACLVACSRSARSLDADDGPAVGGDARLGLPRVAVDDLEACRQAPIAAACLQRRD